MRGLAIIAAVVGVLGVAGYVAVADEPLTLENRVATLEALHGIDRSTPTDVPATATSAATSEPTATDEPTATTAPDTTTDNRWHAPTDHEHGDAPPDWADAWSMAEFEHPVIYGGDESTPGENEHKHNAFKGYAFSVTADDGSTVDIYARVHMQTNPHGRAARFHSCEWYFRDATGTVSLMQWWCDFGDLRLSFAQQGDDSHCLLYDSGVQATLPLNVIIGYDAASNPGYCNYITGREFWYAQVSSGGDWMPVFTVDVYDPSTYYAVGEETTATDQGTWQLTGDYGLNRRISLRWIAGGSTVSNIQGQPYLTHNMANPRGWFCSTVHGEITSTGTKDCGEDLPQYIASSLPTIADIANPPRKYQKTWPCPSCSLPN